MSLNKAVACQATDPKFIVLNSVQPLGDKYLYGDVAQLDRAAPS